MRRIFSIIILLALCLPVSAQYAVPVRTDSTSVRGGSGRLSSDFNGTQLIAPGILLTGGAIIHCFAHQTLDYDIQQWAQNDWRGSGNPELDFDNYIQYIPLAMDLGLGLPASRRNITGWTGSWSAPSHIFHWAYFPAE